MRNHLKHLTALFSSFTEKSVLKKYHSSGQKPWSPGYCQYKEIFISRALRDNSLLNIFLCEGVLPTGYGFRLDERCVEYPWLFSRLSNHNRFLLDAGSALNFTYLLDFPVLREKEIVIYTLSPESIVSRRNISYIYGDLRNTIIKSEHFDEVACISTLEHVGMDNTVLYSEDKRFAECKANDYITVVKELKRLLKPGGRLFITVPYGSYNNHRWLQVFDNAMLSNIIEEFKGSESSITYYRYNPDGWQISSADDCKDCTYFDIHQAEGYGSDCAAAARAVACMLLVK